jgi:hypothetical protein
MAKANFFLSNIDGMTTLNFLDNEYNSTKLNNQYETLKNSLKRAKIYV